MTRKITLLSGCFDGLHKGHLYVLEQARKLSGYLVVTLNHDDYLRRKGPGRPLNVFEDRRAALYGTGFVDEVIEIEDSPLEVILTLRPDFICVGRNDYPLDKIVGAKECLLWGGKVVVIEKDLGVSTTQLVKERLS